LNDNKNLSEIKIDFLDKNNTFIDKYKFIYEDKNLKDFEKRFYLITEYINENSHAKDAAGI
jgi:hypothetical protein